MYISLCIYFYSSFQRENPMGLTKHKIEMVYPYITTEAWING